MALIIEDKGFRVEQVEVGSPFWDLYVKKRIEHKDGTVSSDWKIMHYGVSMEHVLNTIILSRMAMKHKSAMLFKDFFENYKIERQEVIKAYSLETINLTEDLVNLQKELKNGKEGKAITNSGD